MNAAISPSMSITRGSGWGKWDLHVHTPISFESHYRVSEAEREEMDVLPEFEDWDLPEYVDKHIWTKFVQELESVDDIAVLGITDYYSLEGYDVITDLREEGYLQNFDLILPNIEFRLGTFVGDTRINLHVIFSDQLPVDRIRSEFLRNLSIEIDAGDRRSLSRESLSELGEQAKSYHSAEGMSDYQAGCKYATIDLDEIIQQLDNSPSLFEGQFLIILAGSEWSDIEWRSADAEVRRRLLQQAHGVFTGNPSDHDWLIGQADIPPADFRDEFGSLKPPLHGSDAHDFESICEPDEDRYCWIKADTTFEGLKEIVFEPNERLSIGPEDPTEYIPKQTIDSVTIEDGYVNQQLEIEDTEIPFNSNLVTVIGSQGAGKTALLDLIANCYEVRSSEQVDDDNSFIRRIEDDSPHMRTSIDFVGDEIGSFSKEVTDLSTVEGESIVYIPQGKIVEYCRDEDHLHERILNLVKRSVGKNIPEVMTEFREAESNIENLVDRMRQLNSQLYEIDPKEVRKERNEEEDRLATLSVELENKIQEINEFKEIHEEELEETETEELQDELDGLLETRSELSDLKTNVEKASDILKKVDEFNSLVALVNELSNELTQVDAEIDEINYASQESQLEDIEEEINTALTEITGEIDEIRSSLNELSEVEEKLSELREDQRLLEDEIENTRDRVEEIEETLGHIDELKSERKNTLIGYVQCYLDWRDIFDEIAEEFSTNQTDILQDIELEPQIKLDDISSEFVEIIDMRSVNKEDIIDRVYRLREIVEGERPDSLDDEVEEYIRRTEELREDQKSAVEQIQFDEILYGDNLNLTEQIYFENTRMEQLSRGQKGTVLLKIYLAEGDNPLIIDTPEENLDNRFVFDILIDAIKSAKQDRQIFIATHDANLVVNTDSEQVIIAKFDETAISFEAGPLEDENVRSEAVNILEGGDEAFRRRREKYQLNPQ
jgi:ABC-type cobalamin/Fe3+-siderophores transport system ATPase subunit